jgi:hypothetical protein
MGSLEEFRQAVHKASIQRRDVVLELIMNGKKPDEIAKLLFIEKRTVKRYISQLARRFSIPTKGGPYIVTVRIVYLESIRRGIIKPYQEYSGPKWDELPRESHDKAYSLDSV